MHIPGEEHYRELIGHHRRSLAYTRKYLEMPELPPETSRYATTSVYHIQENRLGSHNTEIGISAQ